MARLLALETTDINGSVATWREGELLKERTLEAPKQTARLLASAIAGVLDDSDWRPGDVDVLALGVGPGSFTGLRIGVTTAKTFAYAAVCDVVGLDSLAVLAEAVPDEVGQLWAVMDAHRGELFAARFERDDNGELACVEPAALHDVDAWLAGLTAGGHVTGPLVEKLVDRLPSGVTPVDRSLWRPQARHVAALGARLYAAGTRHNVLELAPVYLRRSAAEERWEERES